MKEIPAYLRSRAAVFTHDLLMAPIACVGAGRAGEMLVRDLLRDLTGSYRPVAFVDDDPRKIGKEIHGIPITGSCDEIPGAVSRLGVDLIIIALPSVTSHQIRRIVEICEATGLPFRI